VTNPAKSVLRPQRAPATGEQPSAPRCPPTGAWRLRPPCRTCTCPLAVCWWRGVGVLTPPSPVYPPC